MATYETDRLAELVRAKLDCLGRLWELGQRQHALIESDDMGQLLPLLAGKQRLIAALQEVEKQLDPFRDQAPDQRSWRSPADRQRCADASGKCEQLLAEVIAHERRCEQRLTRRRDEAAARLQGAHVASQARGAYVAEQRPNSRHLDLSTEQ